MTSVLSLAVASLGQDLGLTFLGCAIVFVLGVLMNRRPHGLASLLGKSLKLFSVALAVVMAILLPLDNQRQEAIEKRREVLLVKRVRLARMALDSGRYKAFGELIWPAHLFFNDKVDRIVVGDPEFTNMVAVYRQADLQSRNTNVQACIAQARQQYTDAVEQWNREFRTFNRAFSLLPENTKAASVAAEVMTNDLGRLVKEMCQAIDLGDMKRLNNAAEAARTWFPATSQVLQLIPEGMAVQSNCQHIVKWSAKRWEDRMKGVVTRIEQEREKHPMPNLPIGGFRDAPILQAERSLNGLRVANFGYDDKRFPPPFTSSTQMVVVLMSISSEVVGQYVAEGRNPNPFNSAKAIVESREIEVWQWPSCRLLGQTYMRSDSPPEKSSSGFGEHMSVKSRDIEQFVTGIIWRASAP